MTDTPPPEGARAPPHVSANTTLPEPHVDVLTLAEENLTVGKRRVLGETVRVRVLTDEIAELARISLQSERLEIERVPVGLEVETVPETRQEGDLTIIPILEEVAVVEKRLVLKEELRIRRVTEAHEVSEPVTLRRQRAEIERLPAATPEPADAFLPETG